MVQTLSDVLEQIRISTDEPAFRYEGNDGKVDVSRFKFVQEVYAVAGSLYSEYGAGNRFALLGENSYLWLRTFFAFVCSSNTGVLLDKEAQMSVLLSQMISVQCSTVFCSDAYYEDMCEAVHAAGDPKIEVRRFSEIPLSEGTVAPCPPRAEDRAVILFTSGTTGISKAVPLTHKNMVSNILAAQARMLFDGLNLFVLPLHHAYGLVSGIMVPLLEGATIYIGRGPRRLLDDFRKSRAERALLVPAMLKGALYQLDRKMPGVDLKEAFGGRLKTLICGSAPNPLEIVYRFHQCGVLVSCGYGITECSPMVCFLGGEDPHLESVGKPLNCNEVKLSESGEILVKGDNVFDGYLNYPEGNKTAFTEDGWFRTGDLGRFGEDGELYITGRCKNLIILSNGENVPPESIENVISSLMEVQEVLVYGENDMIHAEIYADPKYHEWIASEIKEMNAGFPPSWRVVKVLFREEPFPKTTSGKIIRK